MMAAEKPATSQWFMLQLLSLWLGIQSGLIVVAHLVPILGSVLCHLGENMIALSIVEYLPRVMARDSGGLT